MCHRRCTCRRCVRARGSARAAAGRGAAPTTPARRAPLRPPRTPRSPAAAHSAPAHTRRHPTRLKRGRPPLSRKIKERERDEETSTAGKERPRGRPSTETRGYRRPSYDIDNIVIPQSIAANTRPEILTYKEIITPKWRVMEIPEVPLNNGVMKSNRISIESEEEDVSEATVQSRHARAELRERARYVRKQRARRVHAQHEHEQHAPARDQPAAPAPPALPAPPAAPLQHETVRPYSPRQFPLTETTYQEMLLNMPQEFRPSSPSHWGSSPLQSPQGNFEEEVDMDDSSTLSPYSPSAFDGDDPDDAEWDPSAEKVEKRKSSFR
ncbi:unnamed protein product [Parnassius apollo]|uniref:(apollo) hypothetical protein n=1 Tax=Parnassius apollo TaxID=110799 RepID=A0A8S3W1R0_PARAO|nr:unnamed protein product [Parnassius apollo]